jgi:hypothetical protein
LAAQVKSHYPKLAIISCFLDAPALKPDLAEAGRFVTPLLWVCIFKEKAEPPISAVGYPAGLGVAEIRTKLPAPAGRPGVAGSASFFEIWTGTEAPVEIMEKALLRTLAVTP